MPADRPPGRKTYSRLVSGRRMPSEYEQLSSDLHYHFPARFELPESNPVVDWYLRHREGSAWQAGGAGFTDPRSTTYRAYNEIQDRKEDAVDGLLREVDDTGYDERLSEGWLDFLDRWYAPLRFPVHGLQMLAAYIAQLAPSSRITNCAAFQAADEVRRLQRIAYRTAQMAAHRPRARAADHRRVWEEAVELQPLRELVERALVVYDWGEAFVVTNLVIKPHVDRLVNQVIAGSVADANGDPILRSIHFSLDEDARWHRDWSAALVRSVTADGPADAELVVEWMQRWKPLVVAAVDALAGVVEHAPVALDAAAAAAEVIDAASRDLDVG
ncbi:MAG TPA: toluene hydroxylase [Mycobacteriales bacterium]|nr:toluene hydroxylase [Mycobacteriales bacterium]